MVAVVPLKLNGIQTVIFDEADAMLRRAHDLKELADHCLKCSTWLFSATSVLILVCR